jgi:hypothetical protein
MRESSILPREQRAVDPDEAQATSERDQLWANLRALRAEIDRLALGDVTDERQQQVAVLLARIVVAEMEYRDREAEQP